MFLHLTNLQTKSKIQNLPENSTGNLWFLKPWAFRNLILSACSQRWVASVIYGAVFLMSFLHFGQVRGRNIRRFKKNITSTPKPLVFFCFYQFDLLVAKSGEESSWFCSYPELEDFIWSQKLNRFLCVWGQEKLFPAVFPGFWHMCDPGWHYYKPCRVWWGHGKWVLSFEMAVGSTGLV